MTPINRAVAPMPWIADLPVDEALPGVRTALSAGGSVVLQAPPGAGKTTHVPLALLREPWLGDNRIILLEPRRLAARSVTHRMAHLLGEVAGETVGYRIHRDTRVSSRTRIEVVTEGVLIRMLLEDPTLEGVGVVIFDEFHERSIHADTGLALALHSRSLVRPDLKIAVMSATLDDQRVADLIQAPVISSTGRTFPVEIIYSPRPDTRAIPDVVAATVLRALREDQGDILVFLPGGREIRRVASLLNGRTPPSVRVERLYGDLSQELQDAAVARAPAGERKVVLSTPISETSLTIEGIGVVVDSGLARAPRFSPRSGMTRLETVRISRSSADQRSGRAGRTGPGKTYRLWPEQEHVHLIQHSAPEILQADLAPLALQLAAAGIKDTTELRWLDVPPAAAMAQATHLLTLLGALSADGSTTRHGMEMAALPVHPRLAHMLIASRAIGAEQIACDVAAILGDRDFVRGVSGPADADIEIRLEVLRAQSRPPTNNSEVDAAVVRRVAAESRQLQQSLYGRQHRKAENAISAGVVLGFAYPDRIGQSRGGATDGRFLLRNGRGATLTHPQALSGAEYIVAADLDGDARSALIFLGASLTREELEANFADQFEIDEQVAWNERTRSVRARAQTRLGAIVLNEAAVNVPDANTATQILIDVVRKEGLDALPWSDATLKVRQRVAFLQSRHSDWPDLSNESLIGSLDEWLEPVLAGRTSLHDMAKELHAAVHEMLDWQQRANLDRLAPTHYVAPTGSRIEIDYSDTRNPSVAIRLQEMFGVRTQPAVDDDHVALTLHLLSPARRPVQVTQDIAGFWSGSYFEVRKELRGRYPKHVWPEDPLSQLPTSRAKRRGE